MGPESTVDFMAKVIAATPAGTDQDHARLLVDQNPGVPSRQAAILEGGEDPGAALAAMARGLEQAGADFLVMPCNTAHAFAQAIEAVVSIPLVSIIDVTVDACREHDAVGLLATAGCLEAGLYQQALDAAGIAVVIPDEAGVAEVLQLVMAIKGGNRGADITSRMRAVAEALVGRGATALVAACTEIPLVLDDSMIPVPLISSTDVLAAETVKICAGSRPII
jgi:aspartate racemase